MKNDTEILKEIAEILQTIKFALIIILGAVMAGVFSI